MNHRTLDEDEIAETRVDDDGCRFCIACATEAPPRSDDDKEVIASWFSMLNLLNQSGVPPPCRIQGLREYDICGPKVVEAASSTAKTHYYWTAGEPVEDENASLTPFIGFQVWHGNQIIKEHDINPNEINNHY